MGVLEAVARRAADRGRHEVDAAHVLCRDADAGRGLEYEPRYDAVHGFRYAKPRRVVGVLRGHPADDSFHDLVISIIPADLAGDNPLLLRVFVYMQKTGDSSLLELSPDRRNPVCQAFLRLLIPLAPA